MIPLIQILKLIQCVKSQNNIYVWGGWLIGKEDNRSFQCAIKGICFELGGE